MYTNDLFKIIGGFIINNSNIKINNFRIDSKKIKENDVFICINKGYMYIEDAIKNGAKVIIIEKDLKKYNDDIVYIKVINTKEVLKKICSYILNYYRPKVIAITGSVGKTTTKEILSLILESKYKILKNEGNKNNLIGVCETILSISGNIEFLVLELGMNHLNEISELSKLIKPDIGIITNIGSAHIGNLGSKKNILKAKMEILDGNFNMLLFVNGEDFYLKNINAIKIKKDRRLNIFFKHLIINYSLAFAVSEHLGINFNESFEIVKKFKMYKQRMNVITKKFILIDDSYNASLESVIGGLNHLKKYNNQKIIILGDILELGKYSKKIHKSINRYLRKISNKKVLLIGKYTKYINGKHFKNHDEMFNYLKRINLDMKVIYLKGSRKMKLEIIKEKLLNFKN